MRIGPLMLLLFVLTVGSGGLFAAGFATGYHVGWWDGWEMRNPVQASPLRFRQPSQP